MTTSRDLQAPDFPVALRGYDRVQVDEYVQQLAARLDEANRRAAAAERQLADGQGRGQSDAYAAIGARVTAILQAAEEESARMRADAETYARQTVGGADAQAQRLQGTTEQQVQRMRAEAEGSARDLVTKAQAEAQRAQQAAAAAREEEARVLGAARKQAGELLARAQQRADDKAEATLSAAQRESEQMLTRARTQTQQLLDDAARRGAELDAAIGQLDERRHAAAAEVHRLAEQLQQVARALARGGDRAADDSPTIPVRIPLVEERTRA